MPSSWPYSTLGTPGAPAVLFLHGFLGRGQDWLPIARPLAGDFFCILPDLPGHGTHRLSADGDKLTFEGIAAGLAKLLESLDIQAPSLVGYSLGGRIALHFTITHPERVRALILESASPGIENEAERSARAALDDRRAQELLSGGLENFLESWYRADLWQSLRLFPGKLARLKNQRTSADPAGLARALADLSPGRMPSLWSRLPAVRQHTLLLAGGLDEKYAAVTRRAAALLPHHRMEIIAGAGHNIHLEKPGRFIHTLLDFFRQLQ